MNVSKFSAVAITATVVLCISANIPAFADGMPFGEKKPQPILTPLDQALKDIENKEPPVDVTQPIATTPPPLPPEAVKEEPKAAALPEPVPQSRVVEVQPNTSFFGLSVGMYDPFSHGEQALSINAEWQPGVKIAGVLQPLFGALVTTEGALLGYGGVGIPFHVGKRIFVMPSVAVGAYHDGGGYDLGQTLAFRVGGEIAYEFDNKSRLGLNAHILTNGESLERRDRTEIISLVYTTPFSVLSGAAKNALGDAQKPSAGLVSDLPKRVAYQEQINP